MATSGARIDFGGLIQALGARCAEGRTDGQLLEQFLHQRDEAAFAALVRRHGPMVLGVCRRILGNHADADDAFQATFIVVVRKAASLTSRSVLGDWLHGVARRTALRARADAARRRAKEQRAKQPDDAQAERRNDWLPLLDKQLSRLPEKYQLPIVLCDLEGHTRQEAARRLGWPEGTVASRLVRGRALLAKRLIRSAHVLTGALTLTLAGGAMQAAVPSSLVQSTVQAAALVVAGKWTAQSALSAKALILAQGVIQTMFWNKMKVGAFALLVAPTVVVVAAGIGAVLLPAQAAERPQPMKADRSATQRESDPPTAPRPVSVRDDAQVRSLAWSSNGKLLATIGIVYEVVDFTDGDGKPTGSGGVIPHSTIKLWDAMTGKLKQALDEEKYTYIAAIAFAADGKTMAISTSKHVLTNDPAEPLKFETEVRVIDAETWTLKRKVKADGFASALAFSPDGTRLALGGRSRLAEDAAFVRLWNVQKQKLAGATEGGGYRVSCLGFSTDGKQLATGDENGKVRLFDGGTADARRDFEGQGPLRAGGEQCVTGVGFASDGKTLVSGSMDKNLKLWDVEAGKSLRTLEANKGPVVALAVSRDGQFFATAANTGAEGKSVEVLLWDMKTWKRMAAFPDQITSVNSLSFSPDGSTLAIGGGNGVRIGPDTQQGRLNSSGEFKFWKLKSPPITNGK